MTAVKEPKLYFFHFMLRGQHHPELEMRWKHCLPFQFRNTKQGKLKTGHLMSTKESFPEYSFDNSKLNNWQFILRALTLFIISQSCNFCYKSAHITWLGSGSKWWLHTKTRTIQWRQLGKASPCTSLTRQSTAQFSHQSIVCFKIQYREITCQLE